ncbi:adiponectin receptor, partial [Phenoliferia sp. Uapishka_3]
LPPSPSPSPSPPVSAATTPDNDDRPTIRRPRAHSFHPSSPSAPLGHSQYSSSFLNSLDLSGSMLSLREYLVGKLEEAEEAIRALKDFVEEGESEGVEEEEDGDENDEGWEVVTRKHGSGSCRRSSPATNEPAKARPRPSPRETSAESEISHLSSFIATATGFLSALRAELPAIPIPSTSSSMVHFELSPDARLALDDFLTSHPIPSFPQLDIRARLDGSKVAATNKANALLSYASSELQGLQEVFAHLANISLLASSDPLSSYIPSLPSLPPLPTPPLPPMSALRSYFHAESDRLHSVLPSPSDLTANLRTLGTETAETVQKGLTTIRNEANELTTLLTSTSSAALDEAARRYRSAVERGRKRLLRYEELPVEWRNNEHILSGYRFIAGGSWGTLLKSGFEFHNETINIQSHFVGTLSLIYLLVFVFPNSPHALPEATWADTAIAILFVMAAIKCLVCSTAWHLCSGTADLWWHRGAACVDYVGISALIAASVMGMEYYGFYCRPTLAIGYMTFSGVLGVSGMILPWKPWFNEREFKMWRVAFFVGLAASALAPVAHMAVLYGLSNTLSFLSPVLPSVVAYLTGLTFYANQFPECAAPGRWDNFLASHQLWHAAIVIAVWMHWRAMDVWVVVAMARDQLSCAL